MEPSHILALRELAGDGNVIAEPAEIAPFTRDIRGYSHGDAGAVVFPGSTNSVACIVQYAARHALPVVAQGGNTGLCGGALAHANNVVVVNLRRMNAIGEVDTDNGTVIVGAGAILAAVQVAALDAGFLFPLSLGAEGSCVVGGNAATNAGGHAVLKYGSMRNLVLGVEVVLPDGQVWNGLRLLRKDNTGYDLKGLFVGSEGTLGIITRLALQLFPAPARRETALVAVKDIAAAIALHRSARRQCAGLLSAFEYMTGDGVRLSARHVPGVRDPFGGRFAHLVLIEVDRPSAIPDDVRLLESLLVEPIEAGLVHDAVVASSDAQRAALWKIREGIVEGIRAEGGSVAHDVALPLGQLEQFIDRANDQVSQKEPGVRPIPFGHLGDGNLHYNLCAPPGQNSTAFLKKRSEINRMIFDLVIELGGSFSAEHGIGQLRTDEMSRYKQPLELELMRAVKAAVDPSGLINPGKVLPPRP